MVKLLRKGDEQRRSWNIMDASRSRDAAYVPQLLAMLKSNETYSNKRHIIRALGNIGDPRAEAPLLALLHSSGGLMLGDVVHSLGQLKSQRAVPRLKSLRSDKRQWVRQNATWALRNIQRHRRR